MRPATLAEVANRLKSGETLEKASAEFLDAFYSAPDRDRAYAMLEHDDTRP